MASTFDSTATLRSIPWSQRFLAYGWMPIIIGAIAMTATYPGRTHGLGMVTEPLLTDLNLATNQGRVFYSSLNLWGTLIGAAFCLPVGWLFDRWDRRVVLAANFMALGASVLWMSTIDTWPELFGAIVLTRGFGQSALSVTSLTVVAKSFEGHRLGLAMAWFAVLAVPFHLVLIQAVGWALTDGAYHWRTVWASVGIALICLAPIAFLLPLQVRQLDERVSFASDYSLRQALATSAFWVFSITIALWGMIYAGVALFNVDIFRERGFDAKVYFNVLSIATVVGLASKFAFGWLVNYVSLSRLLAISLMVTAVCLGCLPLATQTWHAYTYGVGLGIASGAIALLFFTTWGRLYGGRELGRIQGAAQMFTVLGSASGPLLFSYSKQLTSSYTWIFQALALFMLAMSLVAWLTPLPTRLESQVTPT